MSQKEAEGGQVPVNHGLEHELQVKSRPSAATHASKEGKVEAEAEEDSDTFILDFQGLLVAKEEEEEEESQCGRDAKEVLPCSTLSSFQHATTVFVNDLFEGVLASITKRQDQEERDKQQRDEVHEEKQLRECRNVEKSSASSQNEIIQSHPANKTLEEEQQRGGPFRVNLVTSRSDTALALEKRAFIVYCERDSPVTSKPASSSRVHQKTRDHQSLNGARTKQREGWDDACETESAKKQKPTRRKGSNRTHNHLDPSRSKKKSSSKKALGGMKGKKREKVTSGCVRRRSRRGIELRAHKGWQPGNERGQDCDLKLPEVVAHTQRTRLPCSDGFQSSPYAVHLESKQHSALSTLRSIQKSGRRCRKTQQTVQGTMGALLKLKGREEEQFRALKKAHQPRQQKKHLFKSQVKSPFLVNLVAGKDRAEAIMKAKNCTALSRSSERRFDDRSPLSLCGKNRSGNNMRLSKATNRIIRKALQETSDIQALRAEKRLILLQEKKLRAEISAEKSRLKGEAKQDMMLAVRAESRRRAVKQEKRRYRKLLQEEYIQQETIKALKEKHGLL